MGSTREQIRKLIEFSSGISNSQISETLGISRQLVSYHAKTMNMPRQSPNRVCSFCGLRITRYNASGLCRKCRPLAFAYEFQCGQCGEIYVVTGKEASMRRYNIRKKKLQLDFCTLRCSSKYIHNTQKNLSD